MKTEKIKLEVLTCPSCINKIENVLVKENGVEQAKVLFNSSQVKVSFDENKTTKGRIVQLIEKLGYVLKDEAQTA